MGENTPSVALECILSGPSMGYKIIIHHQWYGLLEKSLVRQTLKTKLHSYIVWGRVSRETLHSMSFLHWTGWDAVNSQGSLTWHAFVNKVYWGPAPVFIRYLWPVSLLKVLRRHNCKTPNGLILSQWKQSKATMGSIDSGLLRFP